MSKEIIGLNGTITHVFAHRFVVETATGAILADVTPKGLEHAKLKAGDRVVMDGEMKPSELKVTLLQVHGKTIEIEHKKKHHDHHDHAHHVPADPEVALRAARDAGFAPVGLPRRKPKHFEVLGRKGRDFTELHIELDGHIRKRKPADATDEKWTHA